MVVEDRWIRVRADDCVDAEGRTIAPYYVLEQAEWVSIMALTDDGSVVAIEEYHHGAGVVTAGGDTSTDEAHALIQRTCCESLKTTLTATIDDDRFTIPFWLRSKEVDGTDEAQKHAFEVVRLAVTASDVAIVFQSAILQLLIESSIFAIGDAVGVDVHRQHSSSPICPRNCSWQAGAVDSRPVGKEDRWQGLGLGSFGSTQISTHGRSQAGDLNIKRLHLFGGAGHGCQCGLHLHCCECCFLFGPKGIKIVWHRQAWLDRQRVKTCARKGCYL